MRFYIGEIADPMFDGVELTVRGDVFIIPELNLRNRRKFEERIARWIGHDETLVPGSEEHKEFNSLVEDVALEVLKQNYKAFTSDQLLDLFNNTQLMRIFRIALGTPDEGAASAPARPIVAPITGESSGNSLARPAGQSTTSKTELH